MQKLIKERIDYRGIWVPDDNESAFEKAAEYSIQQELIKELFALTKKYNGRIKDERIHEALNKVAKTYLK
jgi:hypothetical protein